MTIDHDPTRDWFVQLPPRRPAPLRLLAFPNAGSGAGAFGLLARGLAEVAELWAANLPGRQARFREPSRTEFMPLIAELADALPAAVDDRPYALLGYCSGALLAYGLLRELDRRGARRPERLIAVSSLPPHLTAKLPHPSELLSADFWEEIISQGGFPRLLDQPEYRETFEPALRADFSMLADYQGDEYEDRANPPTPVTVIGGHEDPYLHIRDLVAWGGHSGHEFTLRRVSGGHWLFEDSLETVTAAVRKELT